MGGRVVVITGASSGIGAALAEVLARQAESLLLVSRRADALEAIAARCDGRAHSLSADLTQRSEVRRIVSAALERFGQVDVWVNNVGQGITRPPSQLSDEDVETMMRVNVMTALYSCQEILPHFIARRRGHIINISSMLGRIPHAVHRSAYNGAKHFLNALTANFRSEVQASHPDIQFSLISPGVVRTEFGRNALHGGADSWQLPDSQSAEAVAAVIAEVIESRRPDVYTRPGARDRVVSYFSALGQDP